MALITGEVLRASSQESLVSDSVSVSTLGIYRFSLMRQLLTWQDDGIESTAFDAPAQDLKQCITRPF